MVDLDQQVDSEFLVSIVEACHGEDPEKDAISLLVQYVMVLNARIEVLERSMGSIDLSPIWLAIDSLRESQHTHVVRESAAGGS